MVACLVVVVEFRMGPRGTWRRASVDEHIEHGVG
jgi:hypothetical protein